MIYFSPKLLVSGLSGVGLVAGGLAAWRLTKRTNTPILTHAPEFTPSQEQSSNANQKIKDQCGEDIWRSGSDMKNDNQPNEKNIIYEEYDNCVSLAWADAIKGTKSN